VLRCAIAFNDAGRRPASRAGGVCAVSLVFVAILPSPAASKFGREGPPSLAKSNWTRTDLPNTSGLQRLGVRPRLSADAIPVSSKSRPFPERVKNDHYLFQAERPRAKRCDRRRDPASRRKGAHSLPRTLWVKLFGSFPKPFRRSNGGIVYS
jgi:hypothetical protein